MWHERSSPSVVADHGAAPEAKASRPVSYPGSNRPLGETEIHVREVVRFFEGFDRRYAGNPFVYVGTDLIIYYEEGNPRAFVIPDLFVAIGAPKLPPRETYKLWEEPVPPTFVLEITSRWTAHVDHTKKKQIYARIGVQEYLLYDPRVPRRSTRRPPLLGYRLGPDGYDPMPQDADGALISEALGVRLILEDGRLQVYDRETGERLLSEHESRLQAEARVAELERLLAERQPPS
jgi:Uma2 family endonuclease